MVTLDQVAFLEEKMFLSTSLLEHRVLLWQAQPVCPLHLALTWLISIKEEIHKGQFIESQAGLAWKRP